MSDINNQKENKIIIETRGNAILRQELKNLTPKCDIKFAIIFYNILAFLLLLFGIPMVSSVSGIKEIIKDYSNL
jgi:hypothetical protein